MTTAIGANTAVASNVFEMLNIASNAGERAILARLDTLRAAAAAGVEITIDGPAGLVCRHSCARDIEQIERILCDPSRRWLDGFFRRTPTVSCDCPAAVHFANAINKQRTTADRMLSLVHAAECMRQELDRDECRAELATIGLTVETAESLLFGQIYHAFEGIWACVPPNAHKRARAAAEMHPFVKNKIYMAAIERRLNEYLVPPLQVPSAVPDFRLDQLIEQDDTYVDSLAESICKGLALWFAVSIFLSLLCALCIAAPPDSENSIAAYGSWHNDSAYAFDYAAKALSVPDPAAWYEPALNALHAAVANLPSTLPYIGFALAAIAVVTVIVLLFALVRRLEDLRVSIDRVRDTLGACGGALREATGQAPCTPAAESRAQPPLAGNLSGKLPLGHEWAVYLCGEIVRMKQRIAQLDPAQSAVNALSRTVERIEQRLSESGYTIRSLDNQRYTDGLHVHLINPGQYPAGVLRMIQPQVLYRGKVIAPGTAELVAERSAI